MDKMTDYLEENYEELEELERLVINSLKGVVEEEEKEDVAPIPEIEPVVTITDLANEY